MLILQSLTWVLVVYWPMFLCLPDPTSDHQLMNIAKRRIQITHCLYEAGVLLGYCILGRKEKRPCKDLGPSLEMLRHDY